ncbi:hypothetical protein KSX_80480 [Ktedonospora formicarum]|uniref:Uncharacterized protein n=2 Tax=Ktedonospora formicarum TaxID=2778364 RepID=A0A8J3MW09_9CHLR|nr:hypothetical protein KSX_80480 [Ktedonospora formicarum]
MALYRLLNEDNATFEALMQPHWQQICEHIEGQSVDLLVQDTTQVLFSLKFLLVGFFLLI